VGCSKSELFFFPERMKEEEASDEAKKAKPDRGVGERRSCASPEKSHVSVTVVRPPV
jgi:hypothetical protein